MDVRVLIRYPASYWMVLHASVYYQHDPSMR